MDPLPEKLARLNARYGTDPALPAYVALDLMEDLVNTIERVQTAVTETKADVSAHGERMARLEKRLTALEGVETYRDPRAL